jgi:hypothetical protein
MKTFKHVDWLVSLSLILVSIIMIILRGDVFLYGYFFVGGWQVISMLVHEWTRWFTPKGSLRRSYHRAVFTLVAIGTIVFLFPFLVYVAIILGYALLFVTPFMALFYARMCYDEWKELGRRPLSVLK